MNLKNILAKRVNFRQLSIGSKIIVNMNILFALIIFAYMFLAKIKSINIIIFMAGFEMIYLIISFSLVIFNNKEKNH